MGSRDADDIAREEGIEALRARGDAASVRVEKQRTKQQRQQQTNGHAVELPDHATPFVFTDPATIPRRAWLYGGHYVRGVATATVAPGGWGKTSLTLYECINMALEGYRVWYLSGEDPMVEIQRRIAAHCQHHNVDPHALQGFLFIDDRESYPLFIAKANRPVVQFNEQALARFEAAIVNDRIDVVALDPFVGFHAVNEQDNVAINALVRKIAAVAKRTDCCIEITHHTRKPQLGQGELTADDIRGGSAFVNAVRSCRLINRMGEEELQKANASLPPAVKRIEKRNRTNYIRLDSGKRNMAPTEDAKWWRLVSVLLANGDNVQAIETWSFPKPLDCVEIGDVDYFAEKVKQAFRAGHGYRVHTQSPEWLGLELAEKYNRDVHNKEDVMWIQSTIGTWIKAGNFKQVKRRDEHRKLRPYYAPMDEPDTLDEDQKPSN